LIRFDPEWRQAFNSGLLAVVAGRDDIPHWGIRLYNTQQPRAQMDQARQSTIVSNGDGSVKQPAMDNLAVEREAEDLLDELVQGAAK